MVDERRLLTADCGNSTIDCMSDDGSRLRAEAAGAATALLGFLRAARPTDCLAVSVSSKSLALLRAALDVEGVPLRMAGLDLPCPLRLDYDAPATLGSDRWVGALAAHHDFGSAVVVDCGSATTVNMVCADGTFRGGAIAPGLRAFVVGMAATTPLLPPANLDAIPVMPPKSTQTAIDTGVILGYCGLIERLVADALRISDGAVVVITGGNAERVISLLRLKTNHVPDLVHRGLRFLALQQ